VDRLDSALGEFRAGKRRPAERDLAAIVGVTRTTDREANSRTGARAPTQDPDEGNRCAPSRLAQLRRNPTLTALRLDAS